MNESEPPEDGIDEAEVDRRSAWVAVPWVMTMTAVAAIGAGYLYGYFKGHEQAKDDFSDSFGQPINVDLDPRSLNENPFVETKSDDEIYLKILSYQFKSQVLNGAFLEFANRPDEEDTLDAFIQVSREHAIEGIKILNTLDPETKAKYDRVAQTEKIDIFGREFNLDDPFQFQILSSLVSLKIDAFQLKHDLTQVQAEDKDRIDSLETRIIENGLDWEAISWFSDQKLDTAFDKKGVLLIEPHGLANLARTLRLLGELNIPTARIAFLGPDRSAGGRYLGSEYYGEDTIVDYNDIDFSVDSLIHEAGHYLADRSKNIKPELSQEAFDELIDHLEKDHLDDVPNKDDLFYSDGDKVEQYANFFSEYLLNGEILRERIANIRVYGYHTAAILDGMYNFFRSGLAGAEFVRNVLTEDELASRGATEFTTDSPVKNVYSMGLEVFISDKETGNLGTPLTKFPAGNVELKNDTILFSGDTVQIVDGPFVIYELQFAEQGYSMVEGVNWWRVKVLNQGPLGQANSKDPTGTEGWISEMWFGNVKVE